MAIILALLVATALHPKLFKDENGKYDYKDDQSKAVIKPKYDIALNFSDRMEAVNIAGKKEPFKVIGGKLGIYRYYVENHFPKIRRGKQLLGRGCHS